MRNAVIYIHGKGGSAAEALHYEALFPECDVIGLDYVSQTPWEAKTEFSSFFDKTAVNYGGVSIIGNSIGAYFAMNALSGKRIERAYFISPVVDMESIICGMMKMSGVSEQELYEKSRITTSFGETLSWEYLSYVREHPLQWDVPTYILFGDRDELTSPETMLAFAADIGASLTVLKGGEHWFHTDEQMRFLDDWIIKTKKKGE